VAPWELERPSWRRFSSRQERIAWLERYLQELRAEAQAVEEQIGALKTGQ
jgi:cell division protein FtsB